MGKKNVINFKNNLVMEKRDMNIYHHKSKGVHLISHGSSINISLQSLLKDDYIYLSIIAGSGKLERKHTVQLPAWMNYEFVSEGKFVAQHVDDYVCLNIPAAHPEWKMKLSCPNSRNYLDIDQVTISDQDEN